MWTQVKKEIFNKKKKTEKQIGSSRKEIFILYVQKPNIIIFFLAFRKIVYLGQIILN